MYAEAQCMSSSVERWMLTTVGTRECAAYEAHVVCSAQKITQIEAYATTD